MKITSVKNASLNCHTNFNFRPNFSRQILDGAHRVNTLNDNSTWSVYCVLRE